MKKNSTMRVAALLMTLTLVTTCFVGATFAKYVTSAEAKANTARVAQWGVTISGVGEDLFKTSYDNTVLAATIDGAQDEVVAPGTANSTGITFSLTGTPEVDTAIVFTMTGSDGTSEIKDIVLAANTVESNAEYKPVKFTLVSGSKTIVNAGSLSDVKNALTGLNKTYDAGTDLSKISGDGADGTYKLTWAWDFDANGAGTNDALDTYLGNEATLQTIDFAIGITATQID